MRENGINGAVPAAAAASVNGNGHEPELDGLPNDDPVAVCGFAVKFPDDATSPEGLWKMLLERRCASRDFPADRANVDGFFQGNNKRLNTLPLRGGHFIKEDLAGFDADFFSISPTEAIAMDPMQRWLLEVTYAALENAGIPMESLAGSSTGVYTGCFGWDYQLQLLRDLENPTGYAAIGLGISMLANRLSWFFDLRGPSIGMDSACSSTAMALDIASQALRDGSCETVILAGSNLASAPETYNWMANINFLSPDSKCYSFDHRGNGYARGEGIGVVVLRKLSTAVREGNTIRAVVRATGSNEDGKTPGITQPSQEAQERLIRETYRKAGLSMAYTRYFEAHGTGTPIGDPREAQAIGYAFQESRSVEDPVYVGAIKSNIGHLEGASGLAGLIKAIMVLEKGVIPPNTNFEKVNPKIDTEFLRVKFLQEAQPWPTQGLRRASVNSFGYGGANAHIVLDDAYNYMRLRSLSGNHNTVTSVPGLLPSLVRGITNGGPVNGHNGHVNGQNGLVNGHNGLVTNGTDSHPGSPGILVDQPPRLLVWSGADKKAVGRVAESLQSWASSLPHLPKGSQASDDFLGNLAFTMDSHRSRMPWRSFAPLSTTEDVRILVANAAPASRVSAEQPTHIGFVFTGQGAQWFAMGRELTGYPTFRAELKRADKFFRSLGCPWSVPEELSRTEETSNVDKAEFSQALCTVLQVAMVNLLGTFGIFPSTVVGHSSGEIAAAYASGNLSQESAWKVAYFRGHCSARLSESQEPSEPRGSMMSVGLSEKEASEVISALQQQQEQEQQRQGQAATQSSFGITVACINSPVNVTVSGEETLIDQLKQQLDERQVFARKLRVPLAYHSQQMEPIYSKYISMMGSLSAPETAPTGPSRVVPMVSSVTGHRISAENLVKPSYWALNMISPVRFSQAVSFMCAQSPSALTKKLNKSHLYVPVVDHLLELGPNAALQGPLRDILRPIARGSTIGYQSVLRRKQSATLTLLSVVGQLYCMGLPSLDLRAVNEPQTQIQTQTQTPTQIQGLNQPSPRNMLVDLPSYPFDRSQRYWHESRLSRNYKFRENAPSELLGTASLQDAQSASEFRWRHFIRISEMPWVEHHAINGTVVYPGSGMLVMAIEAAKQLVNKKQKKASTGGQIIGYTLHDVRIESPLDVGANGGVLEVQTTLHAAQEGGVGGGSSQETFEFIVGSYSKEGSWRVSCTGIISVDVNVQDEEDSASSSLEQEQRREMAGELAGVVEACTTKADSQHVYGFLERSGYTYGPSFQCATEQRYNDEARQATAEMKLFSSTPEPHVIHPATLDSIFHLAFTALTGGGKRPMATAVPTHIECLWISDKGLSSSPSQNQNSNHGLPQPPTVTACTSIQKTTARAEYFSGGALGENNELRLWYEGFETTNVTSVPSAAQGLNWEEATRLVPPGPDPRHFPMTIDCKVDLSKLSMAETRALLDSTHPLSAPKPQETDGAGAGAGAHYPRSLAQAGSYMDLLAHQKPGSVVIEIGGGDDSASASTTRALVRGLASKLGDSLRCERYDFAAADAAATESTRIELEALSPQVTFGTVDIGKDLSEQGYQDGSYDVLVVDLHALVQGTARIPDEELRNLRKALKPGAKLIVHNSFPGSAPSSLSLASNEWNAILKDAGFSGADMVLGASSTDDVRGGEDEESNLTFVVSAAAVDAHEVSAEAGKTQQTLSQRGWDVVIMIDPSSEPQKKLSDGLVSALTSTDPPVAAQFHIQHAGEKAATDGHVKGRDDLVLLLLDYAAELQTTRNEEAWAELQSLIRTSRDILWVTAGGGRDAVPEHGVLDGLARTLRTEHYDLQLVTLALEMDNAGSGKAARHLAAVAREMISGGPSRKVYEQDYTELDGLLHTRRLVDGRHLKDGMNERISSRKLVPVTVGQASFEVSTASPAPGLDKGPHYKQVETQDAGLEPDELEIQVKAVSLQPRERASAQGHDDERATTSFADYCAGVVLQAGSEAAATFRPGDAVIAAKLGSCFRSHVRVRSNAAVPIPPTATSSFSDACAVAPPAIAAYHALVEVARVSQGDSVLVRDGNSPIGRASLGLLEDMGITNVWTTVSAGEDKDALGLPSDRILPKSYVDGASLLVARWKRKFDVVLSPYADSAGSPLLSMTCVRPGGRYVMLKADQQAKSKQETARLLQSAPPSVTVSVVQLGSSPPSAMSLRHAVGSLGRDPAAQESARKQVSTFTASELTTAFARLKHVSDREAVVVTLDPSHVINVWVPVPNTVTLNPEATYFMAGGLGSLGQNLSRWLAMRGARHLILASRSGARTPEARELLAELRDQGVWVETPLCDVSDRARLQSVLKSCAEKGMPPIKGCIQASMVMTERVFEQTSFHQWKDTIDPKVQGSWNLHTELPRDLDFFVFMSSMMGIIGGGSLCGYSAGNTYEDALARYRLSKGEHGVALNLGVIPDLGIIVVDKKVQRAHVLRTKKSVHTYCRDIRAMMELICDKVRPHAMATSQQVVFGLRPPPHWRRFEDVPETMNLPFWGHMNHAPPVSAEVRAAEDEDEEAGLASGQKKTADITERLEKALAGASSLNEAAGVVAEGLASLVAGMLGTVTHDKLGEEGSEGLDLQSRMHSYGIDSLTAINVRNWIGKMFGVDMPVFEILGDATFASAGMSIARKVKAREQTE